jgi:hypothetical protein
LIEKLLADNCKGGTCSVPEWKKVSAASEVNGKVVEKVDSVFLEPTDFSKIE